MNIMQVCPPHRTVEGDVTRNGGGKRRVSSRQGTRRLRAEIGRPEQGTLGARIRSARFVPYQAVIGAEESALGEVALRLRDGRRLPPLLMADVLSRIGAVVDGHRAELWDAVGSAVRPPDGDR